MNTAPSITQSTNYASIAMTIGIIVKIFHDPSNVTADEWQILGLALLGLIATITNLVNRQNKGDMVGFVTKATE